jgi:hypothetical protein
MLCLLHKSAVFAKVQVHYVAPANVLCSARRFLRAVGARLAVLIWLCERRLYVVMMSTERTYILYVRVFQ